MCISKARLAPLIPPLQASSKAGSRAAQLLAQGGAVQSRADAALMAFITVFMPPALYMAIHYVVFFRHVIHMYSVLLLGSVPALVIALMPLGLWWLPGPPAFVRFVRNMLLVSGPSCLLHSLGVRFNDDYQDCLCCLVLDSPCKPIQQLLGPLYGCCTAELWSVSG